MIGTGEEGFNSHVVEIGRQRQTGAHPQGEGEHVRVIVHDEVVVEGESLYPAEPDVERAPLFTVLQVRDLEKEIVDSVPPVGEIPLLVVFPRVD